MIKDEQLSDEAVEAAARAIIIANGGDPDALLRLTIHKTTIKAWQQVVPLARAALTSGLSAWPGVEVEPTHEGYPAWPHIILPLPKGKE
jgi:hypothetical protein